MEVIKTRNGGLGPILLGNSFYKSVYKRILMRVGKQNND